MSHDTQQPRPGIADTPDDRARRKWARMDWLRGESVRNRQRACQSRPITAGAVQLRRSAAAGVGFAGLQSCGSIMCPHCGSKIAAVRREDITRGVQNWTAAGGTVLFGTLTLRHHRGQSLDMLADAVADCWRYATRGSSWARDRALYGIAGYVRVWETTYTEANGWHQHVHFLLFVEAGQVVHTPELLGSLFGRWQRRAVALGLSSPLLRAQDLHEVSGEDAADLLGDYFAKQPTHGGRSAATSLGWEVAGGAGKDSRKGATPQQLLDLAVDGDDAASSLWTEYELAMHGRRTIAWSRGLRDLLGLDAELTDEEIAEQEAGTEDDAVVYIPGDVWRAIVRQGGRGPLIVYASDPRNDAGAIAAWCASRGWPVWLEQPPEEMAA